MQASTNIIHTKIPQRIDNIVKQPVEGPIKPTQQTIKSPVKNPQQVCKDTINKSTAKTFRPPKVDENAVSSFAISQEKSKPVVEQVGENDIDSLIKNAYNALDDVHPFDEELYKKVLSLELADDGLPSCETNEPFDF